MTTKKNLFKFNLTLKIITENIACGCFLKTTEYFKKTINWSRHLWLIPSDRQITLEWFRWKLYPLEVSLDTSFHRFWCKNSAECLLPHSVAAPGVWNLHHIGRDFLTSCAGQNFNSNLPVFCFREALGGKQSIAKALPELRCRFKSATTQEMSRCKLR